MLLLLKCKNCVSVIQLANGGGGARIVMYIWQSTMCTAKLALNSIRTSEINNVTLRDRADIFTKLVVDRYAFFQGSMTIFCAWQGRYIKLISWCYVLLLRNLRQTCYRPKFHCLLTSTVCIKLRYIFLKSYQLHNRPQVIKKTKLVNEMVLLYPTAYISSLFLRGNVKLHR